jgi:hypothetical protein
LICGFLLLSGHGPAMAGDPVNGFLAIQVGPDGLFNFGANPAAVDCGPGPTFTVPCRYNLSFEWPLTPDTSFTTVRVDGSDHVYGEQGFVVPPTDAPDLLSNTSAEQVGAIRVSQDLAIVTGVSGNPDTARIRYVITNSDAVPHDVGLRIMIDTMLNDNDGAPFRVEGNPITTETDFTGDAVPGFVDVFYDLNIPAISAHGTLRGGGAVTPDRFVIANWGNIDSTLFDFTTTPGASVTDDSAIGIYWNPVTLGPGESRLLDTFYGLSNAAGAGGLLVTAPGLLSLVPGTDPGSVAWSPDPFTVVAFFTNGSASGALLDLDIVLDTSSASNIAKLDPDTHVPSLAAGQTASATWHVNALSPGDAHYSARVLQGSTVLAGQDLVTTIPDPIVGPVANPLNSGSIPLQADGRFCPNASVPCNADFPGNVGGVPIPANFEWQAITPLAFVPGPAGATPALLNDHGARSFVYTGTALEEGSTNEVNIYLAYDFLSRLDAFGADEHPTVLFDVTAGTFAGPMVVSFNCPDGVTVSGLENGVPFSGRDGSLLGIEGACGLGQSPNPSGDPFLDLFTDSDSVVKGFNQNHAILELEIPLTRNLDAGPRSGGGIYDPSPAFWSASALGPIGNAVLSQNIVTIHIGDETCVMTPAMCGGSTVEPLGPSITTTSSSTTTTSSSTTTTSSSTTTTSSSTTTTSSSTTTTSSSTTTSTTSTTISTCVCGDGVVCGAEECDDGARNGAPGSCCTTTCEFKANGTGCDDGNGCTRTDTCQAGVCTGSNPVTCSATDQCHEVGICDPSSGQCTQPPKGDGAACDDGNPNTLTDSCQGGSCQGVAVGIQVPGVIDVPAKRVTKTTPISVSLNVTIPSKTPTVIDAAGFAAAGGSVSAEIEAVQSPLQVTNTVHRVFRHKRKAKVVLRLNALGRQLLQKQGSLSIAVQERVTDKPGHTIVSTLTTLLRLLKR